MKKYSMIIRDWTFEMEVFIKNGEIEVNEYYFFRDSVMKRDGVPKDLLRHFQGFSEDMIDLDWDQDYGYQGGVG